MAKSSKVIFLLLALTSCNNRSMNLDLFNKILLGDHIDGVIAEAGSPTYIRRILPRVLEYEFIENGYALNGTTIMYKNHFYLIVKYDRVMDKKYRQESPKQFKNIEYPYLDNTNF